MRARTGRALAATLRGAALAVLAVSTGCASGFSRGVRLDEAARGEGWSRVENIAEIRQSTQESCGAAALAMVLGHWGRSTTEEEIWAWNTPPPGHGMRADALRDFAREQGLQSFLVEGAPEDLEREVARDRPVIVGLVKRQDRIAYQHYEVVVGVNAQRRLILTLDPAHGARETSLDRFAREWAAAGRVTIVVLPPAAAEPRRTGS